MKSMRQPLYDSRTCVAKGALKWLWEFFLCFLGVFHGHANLVYNLLHSIWWNLWCFPTTWRGLFINCSVMSIYNSSDRLYSQKWFSSVSSWVISQHCSFCTCSLMYLFLVAIFPVKEGNLSQKSWANYYIV
jgi:hypothetical protein